MVEDKYPKVGDYVVCFIDVLGQRAALRAQRQMPRSVDPAEIGKFVATIMGTVGQVSSLHRYTQMTLKSIDSRKSALDPNPDPVIQDVLEASLQHNIRQQRWSDGIMLFSSITEANEASKMRCVAYLIYLAGLDVLFGLAEGYAVRGGIDIGWASELNPSELYGAAVANAYELESEIAQYPRIVAGDALMEYLKAAAARSQPGIVEAANQAAARVALDLLRPDVDGIYFVDYLGSGFQINIAHTIYPEMVRRASQFIRSELDRFRTERNTKLAFRYQVLHSYFLANAGEMAEEK